MVEFKTVHRQQASTRQCLTFWQLILLAITWLTQPVPVKVERMKRESQPLMISLEVALSASLRAGYNVITPDWCMAL